MFNHFSFSSMKNLHIVTVIFIAFFLLCSTAKAQVQQEVQQRVERYLYSNYTANKAALRENERTLRIMEENLDSYLVSLTKDQLTIVKEHEKEVSNYLQQVQKIKDINRLRSLVEEVRTKNFAAIDRFVNSGLSTPNDVVECKKVIIIKIVEAEILQQKQERLLALLKDDATRNQFILELVQETSIAQEDDLNAFTQSVDKQVYNFEI